MKFVRSPEEVQKILTTIANSKFDEVTMLSATFRTTPEFVQEVLPPPLQPGAEPIGTIAIANFNRSNCVGAFKGGFINVAARYNDIEGEYCLTMPMSHDTAVVFGRELFAEPKKLSNPQLSIDLDRAEGSVERHGIEVMKISGIIGDPLDPSLLAKSNMFHFKYSINPDGSGLDYDPKLVLAAFNNSVRAVNACEVKVQLKNTVDDVYGDIPIVEILGGAVAFLDMHGKVSYIADVDQEAFLPYAFSKIDQYDRFSY